MPSTTSFPSGHSAAAFAFATGVHFPGDVVAGALIGTALAQLTTHALERHTTRHQ